MDEEHKIKRQVERVKQSPIKISEITYSKQYGRKRQRKMIVAGISVAVKRKKMTAVKIVLESFWIW